MIKRVLVITGISVLAIGLLMGIVSAQRAAQDWEANAAIAHGGNGYRATGERLYKNAELNSEFVDEDGDGVCDVCGNEGGQGEGHGWGNAGRGENVERAAGEGFRGGRGQQGGGRGSRQ